MSKSVYFLRPVGMEGPVKIGCSRQPEARLKSLDIWSPFPLELAAFAPGEHDSERNVHWRFRDTRMHGEWFAASAELTDFIASVAATGVLPPLEVAPYGKTGKRRGNNPGRNHAWGLEKARLTRRVNLAETHALGWWGKRGQRPTRITAVMDSCSGVHLPPLSGDALAQVEGYIAHLLSLPSGKDSEGDRAAYARISEECRLRHGTQAAA